MYTPNYHYPMGVRMYSKLTKYSILRLSKMYPSWDFWYGNIPSGIFGMKIYYLAYVWYENMPSGICLAWKYTIWHMFGMKIYHLAYFWYENIPYFWQPCVTRMTACVSMSKSNLPNVNFRIPSSRTDRLENSIFPTSAWHPTAGVKWWPISVGWG
jgi:hypothetical protein